jgi:hypothetical protein
MEDWFIGCEVLVCGQDDNHRLEKELLWRIINHNLGSGF